MHPVIGITAQYSEPAWLERKLGYYTEAVKRAGGRPLILSPDQSSRLPLKKLSGLIISGGIDIDPTLYGQSAGGSRIDQLDQGRDLFEIGLVKWALAEQLPLLGICRGMQVMNVALGGGLVQDIPGHIINHPDDPLWLQHDVQLTQLSHVAGIFQKPVMTVNSRHHQAIDPARIGAGLIVTARSLEDQPQIEAIEARHHPWAIGVQWHPERYNEVPTEQCHLFAALVHQAASYHRAARVKRPVGRLAYGNS